MNDLSNWQPCARPGQEKLTGLYVQLEPYDQSCHGEGLFAAICGAGNEDLWAYLPLGPFSKLEAFQGLLKQAHEILGWETMVIRAVGTAEFLGMASYMRIREDHGSAEVGCVVFSKKLQRTRAATDAMYLMARHVLCGLGYRRYEWKCDNANKASKRAALRFGFSYEGIFRNDMVAKGRNRDTAWYAVIDQDWPDIEAAFKTWLDPKNFGNDGKQLQSLGALRGA